MPIKRALFLAGLSLFVLAPARSPGQSPSADPDRLRGLLYRIDGEARVAGQHPDAANDHARAAQRFAHDLEGRVDGSERGQAERLSRAADALSDAARRREDADVRAAASDVQSEVRRLDESLPTPTVR